MVANVDPRKLHEWLNEHPEGTGWARSKESNLLLPNAARWCEGLRVNRGTYKHPKEFDPEWIQIEDQGQISSCAGNANSSAGEICNRNENRGQDYTQFSRMAAYQIAKERDGIRGDQGSTISSGVWYATDHGYAKESTYPYPNSYPGDRIPDAARGSIFKVENAVQVTDLTSMLDWIITNQGPIYIGMRWTKWMDALPDRVESFLGPQRNDKHGGGHAVFFYGWTTIKGDVWPLIWNSWSLKWGRKGRKAVSQLALREIFADNFTHAVGFTWRRRPEPEDYSFSKDIRSIWSLAT